MPKLGEVPSGLVVVHNQVRPTRRLGVRGFRAWLQPRDPLVERCPCAWAPELGDHYRVKGRAPTTLKRRRRVIRDEGPDPIDVYVGKRVRARRSLAGLSQSELGKRLGVSFQAVQKYEVAEIRLAASTLYRLGQIFSVPLGYFFEGYGATDVRLKRKAKR